MDAPRILVVDDIPLQGRLYCRRLAYSGFRSIEAHSGLEAFQIANLTPPELILSDIAMPGLSGIGLCRALRRNKPTSHIPVILMTGLAIPEDLMELAAASLGTCQVHAKLDGFDKLISIIRARLAQVRSCERYMIDPIEKRIWIAGTEVLHLPLRRYQLLALLLKSERPLTREEILRAIWGGNENMNVVNVTMLRLREDIRDHPACIQATAFGYQLVLS